MSKSIEAALEEHKTLQKKLWGLEGEIKAALEREAILKGRIEQLDKDLTEAHSKSDHYLRWCSEITRQMLNINMFVNNAMAEAKIEVEKGNGRDVQQSLDAVQHAITNVKDASNEPLFRKDSARKSIPDYEANR